uniref:Transgelin n=1 Tax=Parascaris univalens TaxID=6257 RepID=A0A915BCE2_PARUN
MCRLVNDANALAYNRRPKMPFHKGCCYCLSGLKSLISIMQTSVSVIIEYKAIAILCIAGGNRDSLSISLKAGLVANLF